MKDEQKDIINPKHYKSHPSGVECIDVIEHMSFNIGNAIKYAWRQGMKGDAVEDLEKAIWYIQREIRRISTEPDATKVKAFLYRSYISEPLPNCTYVCAGHWIQLGKANIDVADASIISNGISPISLDGLSEKEMIEGCKEWFGFDVEKEVRV